MSNNKQITPEWSKKAVWYQIFPERFRNGNPLNNPTIHDIEGAYPHDIKSPWQVHPWGSDWYELQPYEKKNKKDIWYNIQRRRYGGDLQGILEKLDYLQELGVNSLYLNPVFMAPSSHKYDGTLYHHIDPTLGPDPKGDKKLIQKEDPADYENWIWTEADLQMLQLIQEIHKRNMRIIFDGVFNHMGLTSWPFQDVLKKQRKSKYKNWFTIYSWNDKKKRTKFRYKSWNNFVELPEFRQDNNGIVEGPKQYIYQATKRWLAPNNEIQNGIDGWRLDVAYCIKHPFWKQWRQYVKNIKPDAYLVAEIIDSIENVQPYLQGDEFDAIMNYNFAHIATQYFIHNKITTQQFDQELQTLRDAYPQDITYSMQNLLGSHDTNRIASQIVNRNYSTDHTWKAYFFTSKANNPLYNIQKPNKEHRQIQKLIATFQHTYIGAPMIYYGDEVGMWGANDPCCRKPMIWDDIQHEPEKTLPNGQPKQPDTVEQDKDLKTYYKKLIHIRNNNLPLQIGDIQTISTDNNIYAFTRTYNQQTITIILNNNNSIQSYTLPETNTQKYIDLLTDTKYTSNHFQLQPYQAIILI
ncbi:MAG TPA: glycoside hydrolase family 13 protein [Planctomycetota bacterium]|nr:glycoside hydrolase family 13 protein [Planctomycetota bacterium]HRU51411.1 glycoside hydrolase family 13 protein [Planctomycetota bacterium]